MPRFGRKKKITDYLYTKPVIAPFFMVFVFLAISVYDRYSVEREMAARRHDIELEQQDLVKRKEAIEEKVKYLEGERGIEEELRKRFDVAKEGEKVVILLGDDEEVASTTTATDDEDKHWYQFWR